MQVARLPLAGESIELDACRSCAFVWLDPDEVERVPPLPDPPKRERAALDPRAVDAVGNFLAENDRETRELLHRHQPPEGLLDYVLATAGLPVRVEPASRTSSPWATLALLVAIAFVSLFAFFDLEAAVDRFAFVPADPWRAAGSTLFTHLFVHAGFFHLAANLYFLWLVGPEVEALLGRARFLALYFAASVVGCGAHAWLTSDPKLPLVGASGAISAALVLYGLALPSVPLAVGLRWGPYVRYLHFRAATGLAVWIALQLVGGAIGAGRVAYGAHLGGALVGLVAWNALQARARGRSGSRRTGAAHTASRR